MPTAKPPLHRRRQVQQHHLPRHRQIKAKAVRDAHQGAPRTLPKVANVGDDMWLTEENSGREPRMTNGGGMMAEFIKGVWV